MIKIQDFINKINEIKSIDHKFRFMDNGYVMIDNTVIFRKGKKIALDIETQGLDNVL